MEWLNQMFEALSKCLPRIQRIRTTDRGVKWPRCQEPIVLEPGIHFWWPLVSELEVVTVVRQTTFLHPQTLTLRDGTTVTVRAVVTHSIEDPLLAYTKSWDISDTIVDLSSTSISSVVSCLCKTELQKQTFINDLVSADAATLLAGFGVKVHFIKLTEASICRSIRLLQNS
jgi:regulator of protease activity HflC (stomatin/prohibitin superfamily)